MWGRLTAGKRIRTSSFFTTFLINQNIAPAGEATGLIGESRYPSAVAQKRS